jgi:hypothetical protein
MDGLFIENGPFKLQGDSTIELNPHSWHNAGSVMYIDQVCTSRCTRPTFGIILSAARRHGHGLHDGSSRVP